MKISELKTMQNFSPTYARSAEALPMGRLKDSPARVIIDGLHHRKFTGRLLLSHREKRKKVWMYQGEVFKIQSNLAPELFGQMMIEKNWMSEDDLKKCLNMQREAKAPLALGDLVKQLYKVDAGEIELLGSQQKVRRLIQALTWDEGEYEITPMELKAVESPQISYKDILQSLQILLGVASGKLGRLFQVVKPWSMKSGAVNIAEYPVWSILAGCRNANINGILAVRKQNKLFELVIKNGLPLTLYEGTFGQPRQTIVVRQTSDEHELFFVDQVFRLFSFLTGSANFRPLGESAQVAFERTLARNEDGTRVVGSRSESIVGIELTTKFLVEKKQFFKAMLSKVARVFK